MVRNKANKVNGKYKKSKSKKIFAAFTYTCQSRGVIDPNSTCRTSRALSYLLAQTALEDPFADSSPDLSTDTLDPDRASSGTRLIEPLAAQHPDTHSSVGIQ